MQNHVASRSQTIESKSHCMRLAVGCRLKSHLCLLRRVSHLVSWSSFVFGEAAFQLVHSLCPSNCFINDLSVGWDIIRQGTFWIY